MFVNEASIFDLHQFLPVPGIGKYLHQDEIIYLNLGDRVIIMCIIKALLPSLSICDWNN